MYGAGGSVLSQRKCRLDGAGFKNRVLKFYGVLLLQPISGGFAWFQLSEGAGNAHEILKTALLLLLFLHVGASLFHYFVLKSNLFKRMWW